MEAGRAQAYWRRLKLPFDGCDFQSDAIPGNMLYRYDVNDYRTVLTVYHPRRSTRAGLFLINSPTQLQHCCKRGVWGLSFASSYIPSRHLIYRSTQKTFLDHFLCPLHVR
jgi:hypothetical protein